MAITECGKGHVYDTDQYATCPYCNGDNRVIDFGQGASSGANKTVAPNMMGAGGHAQTVMGRTAAVGVGGIDAGGSKTVAPGMGGAGKKGGEEEVNKTVGVFKKSHDSLDPVVGWLVCIEGPEKGKDYRLWARINNIGRGDNNDVVIKKDNTISKENHARLAYDHKHNNFQFIPGDSTNNIYINDEPVYTPVKLSAYDIIELGTSKVVFVPLCCDKFSWDFGVKADAE
ncbi:MAG: FHA domain-containing protein [Ruminococcus sp.]|nr:FHA domain-containing protein [Ruminococcus sp.]